MSFNNTKNMVGNAPEGLGKHIKMVPLDDLNMSALELRVEANRCYSIDYLPVVVRHDRKQYLMVISSDLVVDIPKDADHDWVVHKLQELTFWLNQIWNYLEWDTVDVNIVVVVPPDQNDY